VSPCLLCYWQADDIREKEGELFAEQILIPRKKGGGGEDNRGLAYVALFLRLKKKRRKGGALLVFLASRKPEGKAMVTIAIHLYNDGSEEKRKRKGQDNGKRFTLTKEKGEVRICGIPHLHKMSRGEGSFSRWFPL